jgi:two-component system, NtrC family, sensor kinase
VRWVWLDAPAGDPHHAGLDGVLREALARRGELSLHLPAPVPAPQPGAAVRPETLYTYVLVPLPAGARRGAVQLGESMSEVRSYAWLSVRTVLVTTLSLLALSVLLTTALGRALVGHPIRLLQDKIRRIAAGDLDGPVVVPQRDELGELAGALNGMCDALREAKERVRRESEARLAAVEQLRHADRLMTVGKLASGVAHELGTPLNVVAGRAQMILAEVGTLDEARDSARAVLEQARRMTQIIRQLLDFARRRAVRKERVALRRIAEITVEMLRPLADKRGVALSADGLGEEAAEVDEVQLQQALTNVVVNALQATGAGGAVHVTLHRTSAVPPADLGGPPGEYLALRVHDTGCGMDAATLGRIFEPFFTTKDVGAGTGLGLSVSYGIVRDHGGWLAAESEPGRGTAVTLYLPQDGPR